MNTKIKILRQIILQVIHYYYEYRLLKYSFKLARIAHLIFWCMCLLALIARPTILLMSMLGIIAEPIFWFMCKLALITRPTILLMNKLAQTAHPIFCFM